MRRSLRQRTFAGAVCAENSVRIDYLTESPNVSGDDRSDLPVLPENHIRT
jgi:hypothetical protein